MAGEWDSNKKDINDSEIGSALNGDNPPNEPKRYISKGPQIQAALAGTIGSLIIGSFLGWSSPVQPQLQLNSTLNDTENIWSIYVDDDQMSWVGSLTNLGALIGALCGGFLMDKFGRRIVLLIISVPYLMAWLLIAIAINPGMLYAGRFIAGLAGGICSVASPSYLNEISSPDMRGLLGMFFPTMICTGILLTSLLGWLDWRTISGILAVFPVISFISMIFVPESPYHLIKKGRTSEVRKALKWLRGPDHDVESEISRMENQLKLELAETFVASDLFKPWALKPLLLAVTLMVLQQLSGINAALFNAVAIFQSAGSTLDTLLCAVLLNVDQLVVTIFSSMLVERLGRRTLFIISEAVMSLSLFALGAFFYLKENSGNPDIVTNLGWLPLSSLIIFIASFAIGAGPVAWLMSSELLPAKIKGPGMSIVTFVTWFLAFVVTKTFVNIQAALTSAGAFWMFGSFCVCGTLFSIFILPETKGKSPEEIQALFS